MSHSILDESCNEALTKLDLFDQFVATDRALEINGTPFVAGVAYGYDLSEYPAPMLLPRAVKTFIGDNEQTIKTAEIRPTMDEKRLAQLTLGLSSGTKIVIENTADQESARLTHVNRVGGQKVIGNAANAEIGRFVSGLSMPSETRKKLAFMNTEASGPFAQIMTDPDFWLLTAAAIQDSADYMILERAYELEVEETDPDTFLATTYSGVLSTQQRPDSLLYSLALRGERERYDKMTVADLEASVHINKQVVPDGKKIVVAVHGTARTIIPGEAAFAPIRCEKPAVTNLVIAFLRKAAPIAPQIDIVFQRGLPDVPDVAPGVDEL